MPIVNIKLHATEQRHFMGKKTGKLVAKIGNLEFIGTREEIATQLVEWIEKASVNPHIAYAKVGDDFRICVEHVGQVRTIKAHKEPVEDGVVVLRETSFSHGDAVDEAHANLLHMAQQQWNGPSTEPPACLRPEQASHFRRWAEWQLRYASHLEAGKTKDEAWALAGGF